MLTETAAMLPLTDSQLGLLVVDQRVPGAGVVYNQLTRLDLDPDLAAADLDRALTSLVTIQPALRLRFKSQPRPHSQLAPAEEVAVEVSTAPAWLFESRVAEVTRRIGRRQFDLENGAAYRFAAVRAEDGSALTLLLCSHHLILDGVSTRPMITDLQALLSRPMTEEELAAKQAARESALANELHAQVRSVAADRIGQRSSDWAAQLRQVPPVVLAPFPGRPTETDFSGARITWTLSEREGAALADLCRQLDITAFVFFTGVYGAVLARHANTSSVLIGAPFLARRTVGAFDLCGFFVNTLPVMVPVEWDRTVVEHLGTVAREAVDFCRANVDIPFSRLVADVRPDRSSNRNPLFSCMLAMQDSLPLEPDGAIRHISEPGNDSAKFDLWLGVTQVGGSWLLELEYDRELISPRIADGLLSSIRTAVRTALSGQAVTLADLAENASVSASSHSDGWAGPEPSGPLLDWVNAAAERTPDAPAIEQPGRTLSYRQLMAATERVSDALAARGVQPGDVIGLAADDLCDSVIAMLAILRRGAAYLPLDPSLPADRLSYMVAKSECRFVIGAELVPGVSMASVSELDGAGAPAAPSAADPARPVYVMFTSGSTGLPKGVLMGHGPLANLTVWQTHALGMTAETRFLQYAPLGFDVSFQEILPTLVAGGVVVSRAGLDRRFFPALVELIAETGVSHIYLPATALRPIVLHALTNGIRLPQLRYVCVSGEQLLLDEEIERFFQAHPHCQLVNLYGPTETHAVTSYRLSHHDRDWPRHAPIGLGYPNVLTYVVDASGRLAPPGVMGELCLGGRCLAEGYLNDPAITSERFVPDRFSGVADTRMYRTGDLVVRDDRDVLSYLGRADSQVKVRGYRIELGEIETVANRLPGVRQAVAVVRGEGADRELLLFVVAEAGTDVALDSVRDRLAETLPAYMCPARILPTDTIPVTGTGKTDRDALVRLAAELTAAQSTAAADEVVEYVDELESDIAALWSELLGVTAIQRDRPLMEYGAHSLNILSALAEVQQRHGVGVPMVAFFASPTVATLSDLVRAKQRSL